MQQFTHKPPAYPVRRPEVIQRVQDYLSNAESWTRLEGAPEL